MLEYEYKHKVLGYKEVGKPIEINDKLNRIGEYLEDIFNKDISIKYDLDFKKDLKSEAKKFFKNNLITFHKVLVEKQSEIEKVLEEFNNKDIKTYGELYEKIIDATKLSSAYNIPIKYRDEDDYMYGSLFWRLYSLDNEDFLKIMNPIFNSVELSIYKTKLSYLAYIHELVHSQVDSVKYNIENYYNSEIASIFFERVAALQYDSTLLELCTLERYQSLLGSLCKLIDSKDIEKNIMSSTYIVSTLKAEKLFDIYLESNDITRSVIMNKMQMLMDGKTTLESILKEMDVTLENSSDVILLKKHI